MFSDKSGQSTNIVEVGPGFWNVRGSFAIMGGIVDIGTHMSIVKLPNGNFLVVDTIPMSPEIKRDFDSLTENGAKIEAVIGTHPFHTLAFLPFYELYPNPKYYGTPRHLKVIPKIPWRGDLRYAEIRDQWLPTIHMRIPAGAEFVAPMPEKKNHFSCVWIFHPPSKTIHQDDTVMITGKPSLVVKLGGYKSDSMRFHQSMETTGLYHAPEAPLLFRDWVLEVLRDWDFDNICAAHFCSRFGGAKEQLKHLVEGSQKTFDKLSKKFAKKGAGGEVHIPDNDAADALVVSGCECG